MSDAAPGGTPAASPPRDGDVAGALLALRPLLVEMNDLKRVRAALSDPAGTVAADRFRAAWAALCGGADPATLGYQHCAAAVAGARLAAIDSAVLADAGLDEDQTADVLRRAIGEWTAVLPGPLPDILKQAAADLPLADAAAGELLSDWYGEDAEPSGVAELLDRLADAPRAGATRPGAARLIVTPEESHADHCFLVAAYAVLLSPLYDADAGAVFLAGLSHHFHNAYLPDAGFTGEELLGEHLEPVMTEFTNRGLDALPTDLRELVVEARRCLPDATTPEGRCFHAADVLDRVLQMDYFDRAAKFTTKQALVDLDLVHPGPVQAFHIEVLTGAGLWG